MMERRFKQIYKNKIALILLASFFCASAHSQTEEVINDLLPLLLNNSYNFDYPTSDSFYRAENTPRDLMDSLYYFSENEWDYLLKRGFIIHDSLQGIRPSYIERLKEEMCFKDERQIAIFSTFLDSCDTTLSFNIHDVVFDIYDSTEDEKYFTYNDFVNYYKRRVQNGIVIFSPIVFNERKNLACFLFTAMWQGHDQVFLVIAGKSLEKWRIDDLRIFIDL